MLRDLILLRVTPLVILLMAFGGYVVWLFVRFDGAVITTLRESYTSVVAMRDSKSAAVAINQAALTYRVGSTTLQQTRSALDKQAAFCRRKVNTELAIIIEPVENQAAENLKTADEAFLVAVSVMLSAESASDATFRGSMGKLPDASLAIQGINERAITPRDICNAVRAMQLGAIDFLEKPIEPVALRKVATKILDRHQPRTLDIEEPTAIGNLTRQAKRLINLQEFDAAEVCLVAASKINGASPEILNFQGVFSEICGDYDGACKACGYANIDSHHKAAQQNMRHLFELSNLGGSKEAIHYGGKSS